MEQVITTSYAKVKLVFITLIPSIDTTLDVVVVSWLENATVLWRCVGKRVINAINTLYKAITAVLDLHFTIILEIIFDAAFRAYS